VPVQRGRLVVREAGLMTVTHQERAELPELHADFAAAGLMPLWTQRDDLMPLPVPGGLTWHT
jgi:hypothetical protein